MIKQGKISCEQGAMTEEFERASRAWNFYGIAATVTPIAAMVLMVWKPDL